jgi:hypothetical protein
MKAYVMKTSIIEDAPMAGEMLKRLVAAGTRLIVVQEGGGMVAGFGPLELELSQGAKAELSILGVHVEGDSRTPEEVYRDAIDRAGD